MFVSSRLVFASVASLFVGLAACSDADGAAPTELPDSAQGLPAQSDTTPDGGTSSATRARPPAGKWRLCKYRSADLSGSESFDLALDGDTITLSYLVFEKVRIGWRGTLVEGPIALAPWGYEQVDGGRSFPHNDPIQMILSADGSQFTATTDDSWNTYRGHVEDGTFFCPERG